MLGAAIMENPLLPRESGQFVAGCSRDVFVEGSGVQKVAEMLYSLRNSDDLSASGWKKANPLAPTSTSDQGSLSVRKLLSLIHGFCPLEKISKIIYESFLPIFFF
ncbi:UPF0553 protein C9orf64-like [Oryzias melastigma]|uniref:UPF0553 protein C9orf64-like n=1 Tax=Oryzias melastigma TaxID=30732 RepID=A0A834FCH9_ORYME|nr:UPF0553 protein C9orf64-like [Oryzias melastigma]